MLHLYLQIYAHQETRLLISIDLHILEGISCCRRKLFIENYMGKGRIKRSCRLHFMLYFSLDGRKERQPRNLLRGEVLRKDSERNDRVLLHDLHSTSMCLTWQISHAKYWIMGSNVDLDRQLSQNKEARN